MAASEFTVSVKLKPWYTELIKDIKPVLDKAVENGMPPELVEVTIKRFAEAIVHEAIEVV